MFEIQFRISKFDSKWNSSCFWIQTKTFRVPNSFSSDPRIPRVPLWSLCILLCVPCLPCEGWSPASFVYRVIPKVRDYENVSSTERAATMFTQYRHRVFNHQLRAESLFAVPLCIPRIRRFPYCIHLCIAIYPVGSVSRENLHFDSASHGAGTRLQDPTFQF